jgi:Arc/MetJ-type ribon-helix-helix transcriptional regulator
MSINLPKDLENSVRAEVLGGHFASEDDMVAAAVRAFLLQRPQERASSTPPSMGSIGGMHEVAELLERVTDCVMHSRETRTLRLPQDE